MSDICAQCGCYEDEHGLPGAECSGCGEECEFEPDEDEDE